MSERIQRAFALIDRLPPATAEEIARRIIRECVAAHRETDEPSRYGEPLRRSA